MSDRKSASEISAFYDAFLDQRMVRYRYEGNPRIERAIQRALPLVGPDARILEIGCGIGLVCERLARASPRGRVWGCDLSPRNIEYARRTVRQENTEFFVADVIEDFPAVTQRMPGPLDLILLVDVIEHLPLATHPELMNRLASLLGPGGALVLTYPSAGYQRSLHERNPAELQPVDEIIEEASIVSTAADAGLTLVHYSLEDVWLTNQYTHCVWRKGAALEELPPLAGWRALYARVAGFYRRRVIVPWRRRRYRPIDPGAG